MKQLSVAFIVMVVVMLSGCQSTVNQDEKEIECAEGYTLMFDECIEDEITCDAGFHEEGGTCVEDTLTCDDGYIEEDGQCVMEDTRVAVSTDSSVHDYLVATSDTFEMFYHEEITSSVSYVTNVYSAYSNEDTLLGYIYKATGAGRWGDITYIIALDTDGIILAFDVIESSENWGAFIELDSFQNQFDMMEIEYYLTNDFELGLDGNAAATTTIPVTDSVIKEVGTLYQNEFN